MASNKKGKTSKAHSLPMKMVSTPQGKFTYGTRTCVRCDHVMDVGYLVQDDPNNKTADICKFMETVCPHCAKPGELDALVTEEVECHPLTPVPQQQRQQQPKTSEVSELTFLSY
jgi:hypothetical protein